MTVLVAFSYVRKEDGQVTIRYFLPRKVRRLKRRMELR